jgi:hypothetical protein
MSRPEDALETLAAELRADGSVISPHVREPAAEDVPHLGLLAAAGPRVAAAPVEYALLIESIREGYLLHYGTPRVVDSDDRDLELLAGDYLYALGLDRLAALEDLEAVRELSDLISLSAQVHTEERNGADALWLSSVTAVAAGGDAGHEKAKEALRVGAPHASEALWRGAVERAGFADLRDRLGAAADSIGFDSP